VEMELYLPEFLTSTLDANSGLHIPAALTPGQESPLPIGREAVWVLTC
jgi:hypothetical protein